MHDPRCPIYTVFRVLTGRPAGTPRQAAPEPPALRFCGKACKRARNPSRFPFGSRCSTLTETLARRAVKVQAGHVHLVHVESFVAKKGDLQTSRLAWIHTGLLQPGRILIAAERTGIVEIFTKSLPGNLSGENCGPLGAGVARCRPLPQALQVMGRNQQTFGCGFLFGSCRSGRTDLGLQNSSFADQRADSQ